MRSLELTGGGAYRLIFLALLVLYIGTGALSTARNLGDVPHYGDTAVYFQLAQDGAVTELRGAVYPWILRQTVRFLLGGEQPAMMRLKHPELATGCTAPQALAWLQLFQILVSGLAILFFLRVTVWREAEDGRSGQGSGRVEILLLFLLLLFDPLVSHHNLSIMTDGLTLSACLVFCAALMALLNQRAPSWLAGPLLVACFAVSSGLRVEKKWVLAATFVLSVGVWLWARRGTESGRRLRGLAVTVGVCLMAVMVSTMFLHRQSRQPSVDLDTFESIVHFRVGFPHLSELREQLPERSRDLLSEEDALEYARGPTRARRVIKRAVGSDQQTRRDFAEDVLKTVLPRRWGVIGLDIVRDAAENIWSTGSFYARVATWHVGGRELVWRYFFSDGTIWNFTRMSAHHPGLTRFHLALSVLVLLLAIPLALKQLIVRRPGWDQLLIWAPCILLCVVNGVFFALVFNYVNSRYAPFAHTMFLLLVFVPAVRGLRPARLAP